MSLREESVIAGPFLSLWAAKAIGRLWPCPSSLGAVLIRRDRLKIDDPASQCANQIIRETVESGGTHPRSLRQTAGRNRQRVSHRRESSNQRRAFLLRAILPATA